MHLKVIRTVKFFYPFIKEYGTEMFAMLDAEFACIIYDGDLGEYIAARDPIGIRPLYYGYDKEGARVPFGDIDFVNQPEFFQTMGIVESKHINVCKNDY